MRMPIDQLQPVVAQYFESVILPAAQAKGGMWAFGSGFIGGLVTHNVNAMVEQYLPMAKTLGVVDANNMVDIDLLYSEATKAMQKGKPTIMGYTMDQTDLDRIRDLMNSHGS